MYILSIYRSISIFSELVTAASVQWLCRQKTFEDTFAWSEVYFSNESSIAIFQVIPISEWTLPPGCDCCKWLSLSLSASDTQISDIKPGGAKWWSMQLMDSKWMIRTFINVSYCIFSDRQYTFWMLIKFFLSQWNIKTVSLFWKAKTTANGINYQKGPVWYLFPVKKFEIFNSDPMPKIWTNMCTACSRSQGGLRFCAIGPGLWGKNCCLSGFFFDSDFDWIWCFGDGISVFSNTNPIVCF